MSRKTRVDLVIPVLNEEKTIEKQVSYIVEYLTSSDFEQYQIHLIISDNGSTDSTRQISSELIKRYPNVLGIVKVDKKGVGLALKTAWEDSQADIIGYMDLDLATDLKHVRDALDKFSNFDCDIVYGSRLHKNSVVIGRSPKREFISRVFNKLIRLYFKSNITDGMCGFKFLRNKNLKKIRESGAVSDGWFFCTELLVVGEHINLNLFELPVEWTDDPDSKVNVKRLSLEYLVAMKELKSRLKRI